MNHLNILLEITDPVGSTVELSKAVTEQGVSNVLSGLMILTFIVMGSVLMKMLYSTIQKISESLQNINLENKHITEQNTAIMNSIVGILEKDKEANLVEQTKWNAERLLKASFDKSILELMSGTIDILTQNHIADETFTYNRIKSLVTSVHFDRINWLNSFKYKSQKLGDLANNEVWVDKKIDIIKKFIYSNDKNKDILFRDLKLAYRDFSNELKL